MNVRDFAGPRESNVHIKALVNGKLVDERKQHNVFVNQGRQWLRNLVGSKLYDKFGGNQSLANSPSATTDDYAISGATYRIQYIGIGIGGSKQNVTPPGPGAQTEVVTITSLESPVLTNASDWYKQVLPQDDLSDLLAFPSDGFTIRFRAIFLEGDISFDPGQIGGYGTNVPVSEVVLVTSQADFQGTASPPTVGSDPGSIGVVAYNTMSPIHKTPNMVLEIDWSLVF